MTVDEFESLPAETREGLFEAAAALDPSFVDIDFEWQAAFLRDTALRQILFGTRRSSKTTAAARKLLRGAYEKPGNYLYIHKSRGEAKRTFWDEVLIPLTESLCLQCKPNLTELTLTFPNGSRIYLLGMDSDERAKKKAYGLKLRGVVVDECALFDTDLQKLIWSVLDTALIETMGWLLMVGMAQSEAGHRGYFYKLTKEQDSRNPGQFDVFDGLIKWHGWRWSAWQNPYVVDNWRQIVEAAIAANPDIVNDPSWIEDREGRWAPTAPNLVFGYSRDRNFLPELPATDNRAWQVGVGIDLGWDDPTAFAVAKWRRGDPNLYFVHAEQESRLEIQDVVARVKSLENTFGAFNRRIVDGANKQAVETIRGHFQLALEPAEKSEKWSHLQMMNGDMRAGWIKALPGADPLVAQWNDVEKDRDSATSQVKDGQNDHLLDAALYLWRRIAPVLREAREKPQQPAPGSNAEMEALKQKRLDENRRMQLRAGRLGIR